MTPLISTAKTTRLPSKPSSNQLTVQTAAGDRLTYQPHLNKALTADSTVYRAEQREIAVGDRIQFNESDRTQGIRRGDFGTVTRMDDNNGLAARLDSGKTVALDPAGARHIDYGYAVASARPRSTERVLVSQDAIVPTDQGEVTALARGVKEMSLYTSDGSSFRASSRPRQQTSPSMSSCPAGQGSRDRSPTGGPGDPSQPRHEALNALSLFSDALCKPQPRRWECAETPASPASSKGRDKGRETRSIVFRALHGPGTSTACLP